VKMELDTYSYSARVSHQKMFELGFCYADIYLDEMNTIIEALKEVNKKDPDFIFTCMKKENEYFWFFAYSNEDYRNYARRIRNNIIILKGIPGETPSNLPRFNDHKCNCPLR